MGKKRNSTVSKNFSYTSLIKLFANYYKFKNKENYLHLLKIQPINLYHMLLLLFPVILFFHPSEAFSTLGGANVLDQSGPETSNGNGNDETSNGNGNDETSNGNG